MTIKVEIRCLDGDFNERSKESLVRTSNLNWCVHYTLKHKSTEKFIVMINERMKTSFLALLTHSWPNGTSQFRMLEQRRHARGNSRQLENFMSVNDSNPSSNDMKVWRLRNENVRVVSSSHMVIYWLNLCIARMTRTRLTRNMCDKSVFVRSTHGVGLSRLKVN